MAASSSAPEEMVQIGAFLEAQQRERLVFLADRLCLPKVSYQEWSDIKNDWKLKKKHSIIAALSGPLDAVLKPKKRTAEVGTNTINDEKTTGTSTKADELEHDAEVKDLLAKLEVLMKCADVSVKPEEAEEVECEELEEETDINLTDEDLQEKDSSSRNLSPTQFL